MALVFTAISNSFCTLLLAAKLRSMQGFPATNWYATLRATDFLLIFLMSTGLYGFGMSLNDIIDRRRDSQLAAHRPLPSGRVGVFTAHLICVLLAILALGAAAIYAWTTPAGWFSLAIVALTGAMIVIYDVAGKYLVGLGLLLLGMIRFFHAVAPAPELPLLWHPLLLLNHVALLSLAAYVWEAKRPALSPIHWWTVIGGLIVADAVAIGLVWWRRAGRFDDVDPISALWIEPMLILPGCAVVAFIALAWWIYTRTPNPRQAGATLMLFGLLWLIVYDVTFVFAYVGWLPALALLMLLPVAYGSVRLMRWWSQMLTISHRPAFKRVETQR